MLFSLGKPLHKGEVKYLWLYKYPEISRYHEPYGLDQSSVFYAWMLYFHCLRLSSTRVAPQPPASAGAFLKDSTMGFFFKIS